VKCVYRGTISTGCSLTIATLFGDNPQYCIPMDRLAQIHPTLPCFWRHRCLLALTGCGFCQARQGIPPICGRWSTDRTAYRQLLQKNGRIPAPCSKIPRCRGLAEEEVARLKSRKLPRAGGPICQTALLPRDEPTKKPAMLEIRPRKQGATMAGVVCGGFCLRMYQRYAEAQGWKVRY